MVLDFSFWSRRMRDDYRALLAPSGVAPEYFDHFEPPTADEGPLRVIHPDA